MSQHHLLASCSEPSITSLSTSASISLTWQRVAYHHPSPQVSFQSTSHNLVEDVILYNFLIIDNHDMRIYLINDHSIFLGRNSWSRRRQEINNIPHDYWQYFLLTIISKIYHIIEDWSWIMQYILYHTSYLYSFLLWDQIYLKEDKWHICYL